MDINANRNLQVVINTSAIDWVDSPQTGVSRKMLERVGDEVAMATSLVKYAPGSAFSRHEHALGEEFLVLEGTFSDEHGDYPAGTYVRNPPGSSHRPFSKDGCTIFVKLRQFTLQDCQRVVIHTKQSAWRPGLVAGLSVLPLHSFEHENVALARWAPGTFFSSHRHWGGEEILVLEGTFADEHGAYPAGTWMRSPHLSQHKPFSEEGCLIYVKVGHL
ncbi:MAG: cupin domain-containing protein [Hahellaceae bacterium]|nr:cupin domain-containing protein [Hahellaceae bacterium]